MANPNTSVPGQNTNFLSDLMEIHQVKNVVNSKWINMTEKDEIETL